MRGKILLLLLALAALAIWWLWRSPSGEDKSWARLHREGVLRVGLDPSYPPFEFVDPTTGQVMGYDVDLARALAERLGFRVEFVVLGFDGLYEALKTARIDAIISAFPYDPTLTQDVAYSLPYLDVGVRLVVREGEETIREAKDLAGKKVGVEWGSEGEVVGRKLARRLPGLSLKLCSTPEEALEALVRGEVDAALVDTVSIYQFQGKGGSVRILGDPLTAERYVIVVRRDSRTLLKAIDKALIVMKERGFLETLRRKWFLETPHGDETGRRPKRGTKFMAIAGTYALTSPAGKPRRRPVRVAPPLFACRDYLPASPPGDRSPQARPPARSSPPGHRRG